MSSGRKRTSISRTAFQFRTKAIPHSLDARLAVYQRPWESQTSTKRFCVLSRQLYKFTEGNKFVEFQTSFRALTLRPGDIIAFTYLKEGFERVPLRVVKLSPSMNFRKSGRASPDS